MRLLALAAIVAATLSPSTAQAARATVVSKQQGTEAVLYWRGQVRARQAALGRPLAASFSERCVSAACAWHRAVRWRKRFAGLPEPPPPALPAPTLGSSPTSPLAAGESLWACVAMAEEGGHNSVAGFFGTIYPPASYGFPELGSSWLAVSWSQQVVVAETILARYGQSAWGPLTQAKCW